MIADTIPPPADPVAEKHVLGIILRDGADALVNVREQLTATDFFRPEHGELYGVLLAMLDDGKPIELAAAAAELRRRGLMARLAPGKTEAGGAEWLADLTENYGFAAANLDYYTALLCDASDRRRMIALAAKLSADAHAPEGDAGELAGRYLGELAGLGERHGGNEATPLGEALDDAVSAADAVAAGEAPPGLATGFRAIDTATGMMQPGDLWIVGAATSAGKSAFAHAVARTVAAAGGSVLIVSAEMPARNVANRLLAAESRIPGLRLRKGALHEEEHRERAAAVEAMKRWPMTIVGRPASVPEIAVRAKLLAAGGQAPALIVLDHLQLLTPTAGDTRAQQIGRLAWDAKRLAMDLDCAVLLVSQLNRQAIGDGRPPTLHGLKESGDVENTGNAVLLLHRPNLPPDAAGAVPVWVRIAKARDGFTTPWPSATRDVPGAITLNFTPTITRFDDTA